LWVDTKILEGLSASVFSYTFLNTIPVGPGGAVSFPPAMVLSDHHLCVLFIQCHTINVTWSFDLTLLTLALKMEAGMCNIGSQNLACLYVEVLWWGNLQSPSSGYLKRGLKGFSQDMKWSYIQWEGCHVIKDNIWRRTGAVRSSVCICVHG
jgi:hypothetical protein